MREHSPLPRPSMPASPLSSPSRTLGAAGCSVWERVARDPGHVLAGIRVSVEARTLRTTTPSGAASPISTAWSWTSARARSVRVLSRRLGATAACARGRSTWSRPWRFAAGNGRDLALSLRDGLDGPREGSCLPLDHPLFLLLAEPRWLRFNLRDGLWVRLWTWRRRSPRAAMLRPAPSSSRSTTRSAVERGMLATRGRRRRASRAEPSSLRRDRARLGLPRRLHLGAARARRRSRLVPAPSRARTRLRTSVAPSCPRFPSLPRITANAVGRWHAGEIDVVLQRDGMPSRAPRRHPRAAGVGLARLRARFATRVVT